MSSTMQTCTGNCGYIIILLQCHGPHLGMCLKLHCLKAKEWYNISTQCLPSITQLCCHTFTYGHMLPCQQNILAVHLDASYLSEPDSKIHIGGHYFLTDHDSNASNNGTILTLATIIHVVSSTSEAELVAFFYNCKNAVPLQQTLKEVGHYQPKTILQLITPQHMDSLLPQWFPKLQKPWWCSSTGSDTTKPSNNVISMEKGIKKPCWLPH